ncbi:unnamed protein product [Orchesella dallaii]|uniref:Protein FMC1 homolog n=1 Tax=Orchesella dallaii TaxID=48710 RepID=A0ABP1QJQ7_9HEXA
MAGSRSEAFNILRCLYRELRPSVNAPQTHVYETQVWKYIVGLCRQCKTQQSTQGLEVQKNLEQTGRSYVLYLQGSKEYHRISDEYKGAGERSADDTAKLLGFKMPHEPKDNKPRRSKSQSPSHDTLSSESSSNSKGNAPDISNPRSEQISSLR